MTIRASEAVEFTAAYLENDPERVVEYEFSAGQIAGYMAASPAKEGRSGEVNQDSVAIFAHGSERAVLVVADGLGGHAGGDEASLIAVRSIEAELAQVAGTGEDETALRAAILSGFERANAAVLELGIGAGTTMIVAEVDGQTVRTYHVGDSGALLTGGRGRIKMQTIAHSPVGYALEAGWIDESEAMVHEERHIVSNVIGDARMRVEIGPPLSLSPRDTLLLASDGLFDNLRTSEIVEILRRGPVGKATVALVEECRRRMQTPDSTLSKPDDLGLLVYRPSPKSSP